MCFVSRKSKYLTLSFLRDNFDWTEASMSVGRSHFLSAQKYDLKDGCQGSHANLLKAWPTFVKFVVRRHY